MEIVEPFLPESAVKKNHSVLIAGLAAAVLACVLVIAYLFA
jgi:hypothetical protein